ERGSPRARAPGQSPRYGDRRMGLDLGERHSVEEHGRPDPGNAAYARGPGVRSRVRPRNGRWSSEGDRSADQRARQVDRPRPAETDRRSSSQLQASPGDGTGAAGRSLESVTVDRGPEASIGPPVDFQRQYPWPRGCGGARGADRDRLRNGAGEVAATARTDPQGPENGEDGDPPGNHFI